MPASWQGAAHPRAQVQSLAGNGWKCALQPIACLSSNYLLTAAARPIREHSTPLQRVYPAVQARWKALVLPVQSLCCRPPQMPQQWNCHSERRLIDCCRFAR
jgi:hypothetical protein